MKTYKMTAILAISLILATSLRAEPAWIPLGGGGYGDEPEMTVVSSDQSETVLSLRIFGIWVEDVEVEGQVYQRISLYEDGLSSHTLDVGKPELPTINELLAIPPTSGVDLLIEDEVYELVSNYVLYPAQGPVKEDDSTTFTIDQIFYSLDTVYPVDIEQLGDPALLRDVRVINTSVVPFLYNPALQELQVMTEATIKLEYEGFDFRNTSDPGYVPTCYTWDNYYRTSILNYGEFCGPLPFSMNDPTNNLLGMLIIYAPDCWDEDVMEDYVSWKKSKGYHVDVVNLDDISGINCGSPSSNDVYDVKDYIQDWFDDPPSGCVPTYVLFVGDAPEGSGSDVQKADYSHIPTYSGYDDQDGDEIFSDYYYQLLSGDDNLAEIALGRWCSESTQGFSRLESKVRMYEQTVDPSWNCDKVLLVSHKQNSTGYTSCKKAIKRKYLDGYEVTTAYGRESSNSDVISAINSGLGVVNYRGHGSSTSWSGWSETGQSFSNSNISALTNGDQIPLVYSLACYNGNIVRSDNCMAEEWTKEYDDIGAVATLGASRPSWRHSNHTFDKKIFESHYTSTMMYDCGLAINYGKGKMLNEWPYRKWGLDNARMYYWIGDPTLNVWHGEPQDIVVDILPVTNLTTLSIQVNRASDNANVNWGRVCVWNTDGSYQWFNYSDQYGAADFPFPYEEGLYRVTVTNQTGPICVQPCITQFTYGTYIHSPDDISLNFGEWSDLAIQPGDDNVVHLSFYDNQNKDLRYLIDNNGSFYQSERVDGASSDVGLFTSIALDLANNPHITYWDETERVPKHAYKSGGQWYFQPMIPEQLALASDLWCYYTNVEVDQNNKIHGCIYLYELDPPTANLYGRDLIYVHGTGNPPEFSNYEVVDTAGDVGCWCDLALGPGNIPHISYYDGSNFQLKYAVRTPYGWNVEVVDSEGHVGKYSSIAVDQSGYPHISYYESLDQDLKYAYKDASGWHIATIETAGDVGRYTSICLNENDIPVISYVEQTEYEVRLAKKVGSGWYTETIESLYAYHNTSLGLDFLGRPVVSYYDGNNMRLRVARLRWLQEEGEILSSPGELTVEEKDDVSVFEPMITSVAPNLTIGSVTVCYQLPNPTNVRIAVYDVTGREIKTLLSSERPAGEHQLTWEGVDNSNRHVPTGVYFIRMQAGDFQACEKITLLR